MRLTAAVLVVLVGVLVTIQGVKAPAHTFEERWAPVRQMPPMQDRSERPLTFEERWEPVRQMPRMLNEQREQREELLPRVIPVRTITIRREDVEPPAEELSSAAPEAEVPLPKARPLRTIRKATLDICRRHNMRKVHYGRTWRCRR